MTEEQKAELAALRALYIRKEYTFSEYTTLRANMLAAFAREQIDQDLRDSGRGHLVR